MFTTGRITGIALLSLLCSVVVATMFAVALTMALGEGLHADKERLGHLFWFFIVFGPPLFASLMTSWFWEDAMRRDKPQKDRSLGTRTQASLAGRSAATTNN